MNIDENVQKVVKLLLRKWKLLILFMLIGALLALSLIHISEPTRH